MAGIQISSSSINVGDCKHLRPRKMISAQKAFRFQAKKTSIKTSSSKKHGTLNGWVVKNDVWWSDTSIHYDESRSYTTQDKMFSVERIHVLFFIQQVTFGFLFGIMHPHGMVMFEKKTPQHHIDLPWQKSMPLRIWGEEDVPWTFFEREITSRLFFFQRSVVATQLFSPRFFRAPIQFDVFYFSDGLEKNHQLALNWCCFFGLKMFIHEINRQGMPSFCWGLVGWCSHRMAYFKAFFNSKTPSSLQLRGGHLPVV